MWPKSRQDHVTAHVEDTRAVEHRKVDIGKAEIRIGSDTVKIAPVLSPHVDDVRVRRGMARAPGHTRRVNAETFEVFQHKVAQQILSDLANHPYAATQPAQAGSGVCSATARAENVSIDEPQLPGRGQRVDGAREDIGDQDSSANHVHKLGPKDRAGTIGAAALRLACHVLTAPMLGARSAPGSAPRSAYRPSP